MHRNWSSVSKTATPNVTLVKVFGPSICLFSHFSPKIYSLPFAMCDRVSRVRSKHLVASKSVVEYHHDELKYIVSQFHFFSLNVN